MKYKLINRQTGEEYLCEKWHEGSGTLYVTDDPEYIKKCDWFATKEGLNLKTYIPNEGYKAVVACSNYDHTTAPHVEDSVMAAYYSKYGGTSKQFVFQEGYEKAQETHPFSKEDMIEFVDFVEKSMYDNEGYTQFKANKELLQIWKEQRIKTLYYE